MRARSRHHGAKKSWCCGQRASVASVRTGQRLAVVGRASHTATLSFARGGLSLLALAARWRGEGKRADRKTTGRYVPSASGGLRDAYDQVTHPEERGHPCGEAVHDDDRGWMVKSGEIGGFVGGSLKHPRQRLGAQ